MKINSAVSTLLALVLIGVRIYNVWHVSRDLPCTTSMDEKPKQAFGSCKDNVQTYHDTEGKPTGITRECGTLVSDVLTSVSCGLLTGSIKDTVKICVQFGMIIFSLVIIYVPLPESLKRILLVVGSVISWNGRVFGGTLLVAGSMSWSVIGDVLMGAGNRLLYPGIYTGYRGRARDGRFLRST